MDGMNIARNGVWKAGGDPTILEEVRFQQKNHFLLKNLDFLIKNLDFLIKNLHLNIKHRSIWRAMV